MQVPIPAVEIVQLENLVRQSKFVPSLLFISGTIGLSLEVDAAWKVFGFMICESPTYSSSKQRRNPLWSGRAGQQSCAFGNLQHHLWARQCEKLVLRSPPLSLSRTFCSPYKSQSFIGLRAVM
jgi:hypothetical protein